MRTTQEREDIGYDVTEYSTTDTVPTLELRLRWRVWEERLRRPPASPLDPVRCSSSRQMTTYGNHQLV